MMLRNLINSFAFTNLETVRPITIKALGGMLLFFVAGGLVQHLLFFISSFFLEQSFVGITNSGHIISAYKFSYITFISTLFVQPIGEEILLRWGLRYSPFSLSVFIIGIVSSIIGFFDPAIPTEKSVAPYLFVILLLIFGVMFLLYFLIKKNNGNVRSLFEKHYTYIFFLSVFVFGVGHITHYSIGSGIVSWLFVPIMLLPFVWFGYFMSLIRLRYGLVFSILGHIAANSLVVLFSLAYV